MQTLPSATLLFPELAHTLAWVDEFFYLDGEPVTGIEFFCGAGGLSLAFQLANGKLVLCVNHDQYAIASHRLNFEAEHWLAPVELLDMNQLCDADVLFGSPECTNQTNARGKRLKGQRRLGRWTDRHAMSKEEQSRASMWQMYEAARAKAAQEEKGQGKRFKLIFIENVVEAATLWADYDDWVEAIKALGYEYKALFQNAMFFGVPQSRDRYMGVFWLKGLPSPDLDFRPRSYCPRCDEQVAAIQRWKTGKDKGDYGVHYDYCCPNPECNREIVPFYRPAAAFVDFSNRGVPIKDRHLYKNLRSLCPNTRSRIQSGIEQFFSQPQIAPPEVYGLPMSLPPTEALPFWVKYNRNGKAYSVYSPICTLSSRDRCALVFPPPGWTFADGIPALSDCGYRMLTEEEVQAAMCLHHLKLADGCDRVAQCGLAVPPPLALAPLLACIRVLHQELPELPTERVA